MVYKQDVFLTKPVLYVEIVLKVLRSVAEPLQIKIKPITVCTVCLSVGEMVQITSLGIEAPIAV